MDASYENDPGPTLARDYADAFGRIELMAVIDQRFIPLNMKDEATRARVYGATHC